MRRRDFITLMSGATLAWPLAARAQQQTIPVIGFLSSASLETLAHRISAIRLGLQEIGYVDGKNVVFEFRTASSDYDKFSAMVADLVRRKVTVIAAFGPPAALAARAATATIPFVFIVGSDPVGLGLVASLNRPGGNLTGINFFSGELVAKRLELLHEMVPGAARIAVLVNPAHARAAENTLRDTETAARAMGLQIQVLKASTSGEINAAFATFVRERPDAVFVSLDPFFSSRRVQIVNLASYHRVPATYGNRDIVEAGGLMSYGASLTDANRQMGVYAGRILRGAKPADLPVVQATKFELVINNTTARMFGLTVPPSLLAIADEVIE